MRVILLAVLTIFIGSCKQADKSETSKSKTAMTGRYTAPEWVRSTNIYEVNVRQYTSEGTLNAFARHLPRLKEMGVETLWFMPLTPIAQKNRKGTLGSYYACSDYTSVNPEFGTLDDFKNLVKEAHQLGFKVILDWVANHTGWDHKWTKEHPEYYLIDPATNDFQVASGMDDIIELDFNNKELRKAMKDAMKFWIEECDIDGFRADLAFWVELDFWKEARAELDVIKPLFWLGEYDELDNPEYGEAFDASYSWTWMHRAKDFYQQKQPLDSLYTTLKRYDDLGDSTMRAWFTTNHDENSWNGTEYEKYGDMALPLAVFSATWNGVPLLYSGQEIGNRKRIEFFEKDIIVAAEDAERLTSFYSTLLHLKKNNPALRGGAAVVQTFRIKTTEPASVFSYLRKKGDREVFVVLNLSGKKVRFDVTDANLGGTFRDVFSQSSTDFTKGKSFDMGPWEFLVYEK